MFTKIRSFLSSLFGRHEEVSTEPIAKLEPLVEPARCPCGNDLVFGYFKIKVRGAEFEMGSDQLCPLCVQKDCEEHGTTCAECGKPILPGELVGMAPMNPPYPFEFTHLSQECSPGLFTVCGRWGKGRLITLHELNPEKFPSGTISPIHAAFSGGGPVFVSSEEI